jgi:hypothetical protein
MPDDKHAPYLLLALNGADALSTMLGITFGGWREANPVMHAFVSNGYMPFVLAKLLIGGLMIVQVGKLRPRACWWLSAVFFVVVSRNLWMLAHPKL